MKEKLLSICEENKTLICIVSTIITTIVVLQFVRQDKSVVLSAGIVGVAVFLYSVFSRKDAFNPIALYSISWLGCIGLANLRLSYDQEKWTSFVWINLILAYVMFILGYFMVSIRFKKQEDAVLKSNSEVLPSETCFKKSYVERRVNIDKIYRAICIVVILAIFAFVIEVVKLRMIPLFSKEMSAYRDFHVSGVHYFTVAVALIPSLAIIYIKNGGKNKLHMIIFCVIAFLIPVLIVSRQLILFEVLLVIFTYNYCYKRISTVKLVAFGVVLIVAFSVSSIFRHQNMEYIYAVSNFKYLKQSVLTQPYLYFTMSFENMRNLIVNCKQFQYGVNTFFPVFAFTGLKSLIPVQPTFLNNVNFNVCTYLFDIYLDFGIYGVVIITFLLGALFSYLYHRIVVLAKYKGTNIAIYAIFTYAILFSFFTNWYSNPSIFFDIVLLYIINKLTLDKVHKVEENKEVE